jgi:hypothetical protein
VDVPVPGAGYTFGQLRLVLAMGDFESRTGRRKLVLHLHLTEGLEPGLLEVERAVQRAVEHTRDAGRM